MRFWPEQTYRRYEMALLCTMGTLLCYADRTNIGIAIPSIEPDHAKQGQILSSFYYGYICTQLLGAHWASIYGPKRVLVAGVVVWTCFDVLTITTASSPAWLRVVRVGMGLGEGILFPTLHTLSASWYPATERSRLMSIVSSGVDLGTIVAMAVSPLLLASLGWRSIFLLFGLLSTSWVLLFLWRGSSKPETDAYITTAEKATILSQRGSLIASSPPPWRRLVLNKHAWAVYAAHFAFNYGWYVLLGWMPQYFREKLHLSLASSGLAAACPYIAGYVGVLFWGMVSDRLLQRYRVLHVRQTMNAIGLLGAALALYLLRYAASAPSAIAMLCLTLFFARAATLGYWVNMVDIGPSCAGHIMGVSNTIATLPGILGNVLTGYLLGHGAGNWDLVFDIASALLVLGAVVFQVLSTDRVVIEATAPRRSYKKNDADDVPMQALLLDVTTITDDDDDDDAPSTRREDGEFFI
ncbi:hypothetical protein SPRG_19213 [Saprolegnia parasitica CBS 223.65]|uniref:Major facilitator superfamily (MFS) profile domain-containing protein n=1 Tax=Saprolegnia parasitica (strain CBS 223.65) TaxID=695850 RepID=A0A067D3J0_SAPPC|nr:hypothetical protein SPRG_19213 [Saprolegnia parasitica CBS 223.65]KDO33582.1 hypothetical protein SPRG_19213 [Saprolegnia parasitica CBS 223.65]|eukprot:XP_012195634.1 hypothetical protein SPRG_19213 [Saprolegnia parasitica CBS 223.65]